MERELCKRWPHCTCAAHLSYFQEKLPDENIEWTFKELQAAETLIFGMLSCLGERCPKPQIRAAAHWQLYNPFWDRQRRKHA